MVIWHISDTHGGHESLVRPDNFDVVIHSGDFSNSRENALRESEVFIDWYASLDAPYKVLVAGNHDFIPYTSPALFKDLCMGTDICYLEESGVTFGGYNIWGTPYTPTFNDWAFMKNRDKMYKVWDRVPITTDILVTHGPPKGVLDLSTNRERVLEMCGCTAMANTVFNRLQLKACLFGHIHNSSTTKNSGILTLNGCQTIFSNGSTVTDGKHGQLTSHGNILKIE